jgi:hypothetical protein
VSAVEQALPRGLAGVWSCGHPTCPVGAVTLALRFRPGCALPGLVCPLAFSAALQSVAQAEHLVEA